MPRSPKFVMRPAHRPKIKIDWEAVDKFVKAGASGPEIAGFLGIHYNTFYLRYQKERGIGFSEARPSGDASGCAMLRLRQFQSAMSGNTRMLEVLGKERLGQGQNNFTPPNDKEIDQFIAGEKDRGKSIEQESDASQSETSPEHLSSHETI